MSSPGFIPAAEYLARSRKETEPPQIGRVVCDECGELHEAVYDHEGRFGEGPIYAVVCTRDHLTDYYTTEALVEDQANQRSKR